MTDTAAGLTNSWSTAAPNFESPRFQGWRDSSQKVVQSQVNVPQLNILLQQEESTLRACDPSILPDGGQRIKDRINNLKLRIAEHSSVPQQYDPPISNANSLVQNQNLATGPLQSRPPTVVWAGPPNAIILHRPPFPPVIASTGLPNAAPPAVVYARPPPTAIPTNAIVWAGPPSPINLNRPPPPFNNYAPNMGGPYIPPNRLNPAANPFIPAATHQKMHPNAGHFRHQNQRFPNGTQSFNMPKSFHPSFSKQYYHNIPRTQYNNASNFPTSRPILSTHHHSNASANNNGIKTYSKQEQNVTNKPPHANQHPIEKFNHLWSTKSQQHQYYGGRMTKTRVEEVQIVTQDAVEKLHKSLEGCPGPEVEAVDPLLLESSLMPHQRQALAWLLWREGQSPPGGILADDMGLGKTLTMISLVLKQRQLHAENDELQKTESGLVKSKATLVVCPASLLLQWEKEVNIHCESDALKVCLYHGANREKDVQKLAENDVIITTYAIVTKEIGDCMEVKENDKSAPTLLRIAWERVVLDEAHTIKNPKSKGCNAVCHLRATYRWVLTGTPIHNNLLDMYALLKFLRVTPFDELKVWKKWVDNKSPQGTERLNALIKSLLLRRTKDQLDSTGKALVRLPKKVTIVHTIKLSQKEKEVYDKFYTYFKNTLNNVLLMKGAEKGDPKKDTFRGSQCLLFTLLLRLQQICNHLHLILQTVKDSVEDDPNDLADQLESLTLEKASTIPNLNEVNLSLSKYKEDPDFRPSFGSTKVTALMAEIKEICQKNDKCVVVSQWTSMLSVIATHLKSAGIHYCLIQGSMLVKQRMACLEEFNDKDKKAQVMLLSLKAGGVGLNLTGGNHLFLIDAHWNPALESQACDRVYRVGQTKDVTIHRFLCENSVEEQILSLQKKKMALASAILEGGAKCSVGITLEDLKLLFSVK